MYFDFRVPIPEERGKIYPQKKDGVTYVQYEYDRVYKPDKKYNIPKRTTIGRVCEDDSSMMYPNPNFLKYFPDAEIPTDKGRDNRSGCLRIGNYIVLKKMLKETMLDKIICGLDWDERGSGLFMDLASYYVVTENNAGQYYPDYAYNHPLFTPEQKIYSDSTVSRFLQEISVDDSIQLQNDWNENKDHRQRIYISYDSTNKNCQAGDIDIVEYGHAKYDQGLPVFNVSIAYDTKNREPLFYEEYPGSVVDIAQLQYMLGKAQGYGYKHVGFILDRGYFGKANIHYMDNCGYNFVIMVKGMRSLVKEIVKEVKSTFETKRTNYIRRYQTYGVTIKRQLYPSDENERYFHIYYSSDMCTAERTTLENKIDKMAKQIKKLEGKPVLLDDNYCRYFTPEYYHEGKKDQCFVGAFEKENVIEEELGLCGYFCIISSEDMTAKEALELYKSRDASEKLFRADKSFLGNKSSRVYTEEGLGGKLLIGFVALIIRNRMYTKIKDAAEQMDSVPNYMNVAAAIRELEKIELIRGADGIYRLDHAVTKTQRTILNAFGISNIDIKAAVNTISEQFKPIDYKR